jgi:cobalt-zinc-cadmium efflux system protein
VLLLRRHSKDNINIRAAYLHLFADTLSSVAVIAGGILMWVFEWYWVDPLVTVLIGIYILKETYSILRESIDILMQAAPRDIDLNEIQKLITAIDGVSGIHHVHIWRLTDRHVHFESHISLENDLALSDCKPIRTAIERTLDEKFGIEHVTVQFEYQACEDEAMIRTSETENNHTHHK